jgi:hypothetical protein
MKYLDHLEQFLSVLQAKGLQTNPTKCVFPASSLEFLGHTVSEASVVPTSSTC